LNTDIEDDENSRKKDQENMNHIQCGEDDYIDEGEATLKDVAGRDSAS